MPLYRIGPGWLGLYVETESDALEYFVKDVYNGFPADGAPENAPRMLLEIEEARVDGRGKRGPASETGRLGDLIYNNNGRGTVEAVSTFVYASLDFRAREGRIKVGKISTPDLDTIMRQVIFRLAAATGLVTLHSVSWLLNGKAYLSCGGTYSGKTTIGNLLRDSVQVLSDEFNFVGTDPGVRVWRAPMRPVAPLEEPDESYPLGALAFHKKGKGTYVKRLSSERGFRELSSHLFLGVFTPGEEAARAFDVIYTVVNEVPFFELVFTKNGRGLLNGIKTIGGFTYE